MVRKPLLALALLVGTVALAAQQASTANNAVDVESNIATYRSVSIQNTSTRTTSLKSVSYTNLVPGTTNEVTAVLSGDLSLRTIRARYGTDTPVNCSKTLVSVVGGLLGAKDTQIRCGVFTEDADRPRALTFQIS